MKAWRPEDRAYFYSFYANYIDEDGDLIEILTRLFCDWEKRFEELQKALSYDNENEKFKYFLENERKLEVVRILAEMLTAIKHNNEELAKEKAADLIRKMGSVERENLTPAQMLIAKEYVFEQLNAVKITLWKIGDAEVEFDDEVTVDEMEKRLRERLGIEKIDFIEEETEFEEEFLSDFSYA